jgi:pimeloyl-ACP methyl ester carboxylesterase
LTTVNGGGAAVDPAAFWDFTFTDMGLDYKAFAQEMSSRHVDQKGHFIGLSTSTLSMFAAIS